MKIRYNKNRKVNIKTCSQKCGKFLSNTHSKYRNSQIIMYNNRSERRRNENKILIKSIRKS